MTSTQLREKPHKKTSAAQGFLGNGSQRALEQAALALDDASLNTLDAAAIGISDSTDALHWEHVLRNVATNLSLALAEFRGPQRFHYHYRHDPNNYDTMVPVAGPSSAETLAHVCEDGLKQLLDVHGVVSRNLQRCKTELEHAMRHFLALYKQAAPKAH